MEINGYELSRNFWNWCFENPEKVKPNHPALFHFIIEHCNRLGWKKKFGLPTTMAKDAIGIRSYNTYSKTLNDLVEFGFIILIEKSKNQYSSNIIALSNFNKAHNKALDKAFIKHDTKQSESTVQSIDSIDKPITNNHKPITKEKEENFHLNKFGYKIFMNPGVKWNEKLQLEYEWIPNLDYPAYGNSYDRSQGGKGNKAIAEHCKELGIEYKPGDELIL